MKILLTLFVLFFSSLLFAEDISDFEIEGMSIGDSLLDYMSEDEIMDAFSDLDKYSLAAQEAKRKAEEEAKKAKQQGPAREGGGGGGNQNNNNNNNSNNNTGTGGVAGAGTDGTGGPDSNYG